MEKQKSDPRGVTVCLTSMNGPTTTYSVTLKQAILAQQVLEATGSFPLAQQGATPPAPPPDPLSDESLAHLRDAALVAENEDYCMMRHIQRLSDAAASLMGYRLLRERNAIDALLSQKEKSDGK